MNCAALGFDTLSSSTSPSAAAKTPTTAEVEPSANKLSYAEHKEKQKQIRKAEKAVKEAENKIEALEKRLKELDEKLCMPENASNMKLIEEYASTQKALDKEVEEWERLSERLDGLQ